MAQPKNIGITPEEREEQLSEKLESISVREKEAEAQQIASGIGLEYVNLEAFPIDQRALVLVPRQMAMEMGAIAFRRDDNNVVHVGLFVPEDEGIRNALSEHLGKEGYEPQFYVISELSLEKGIRAYDAINVTKKTTGKVGLSQDELEEVEQEIRSLSELEDRLKDIPVSDILGVIMGGALVGKASDVHLEPEENSVVMRYRIDGVLNQVAQLSSEAYPKIVSRVKLEAGLKINVKDKPQDGRFSVVVRGEEVDIRVSVLPTAYGETIVMRLLGVGAVGLTVEDLGVRGQAKEVLMRQIKKPNGMVLITGPTGSGKTTSLYAALNEINTPGVKIVTLENPIEYQIEGISQTQIDPKKELTFAAGLKSILRQDPDVIMVGEIRDFETADIASQAALTGHLVFSTLHTNDSSGVIPRLVDLGLRPFTIAPALNAVIAQRLVRKLDEKCKTAYEPTEEEVRYLKEQLGDLFPEDGVKQLYGPGDCSEKLGQGYKGRIGVFEIFEVDKKVEALINDRASALQIFELVVKEQGMTTMLQDGLLRVIAGETSLEEVRRVLD
jgi:type II secretory ATPase GspE/PulE/Tfp pilus assembly ATPase PilB-like protein